VGIPSGDPPDSCNIEFYGTEFSSAAELVSSKAVEALLMKLPIGNRTALLSHTRLAEGRVSLKQLVVLFALDDITSRRPGW
jgi:hypothetical protein